MIKYSRISMIKKPKLCFITLGLLILLFHGCSKPEPTSMESGDIDTSQEPSQTPYASNEIFTMEIKDGLFTIKPLARYKASVMVVGKKSYSYGWAAKVAPTDLALVWGKLAEPEYDKYMTYSQSDRWYFFEYKPETPFNASYIIKHSSNNHIIPATENIQKAVKSIKKKQRIILEGFLVKITGTYKGEKVWWNSSLTRNDTGDNSCELFYVTKVRIGNNVYQ
jgi:hypothetical protein